MRQHPTGLRSVLLDAVYPPDFDLYVEAPANFERALNALFRACATSPVCGSVHPDLPATFFDVVDCLNDAPLVREVEDFFSGETLHLRMDGDTILALTFQLLYDSRLRYILPGQIAAASQGGYTAFGLAQQSTLRLASLSGCWMAFLGNVPLNGWLSFYSILAPHLLRNVSQGCGKLWKRGTSAGVRLRHRSNSECLLSAVGLSMRGWRTPANMSPAGGCFHGIAQRASPGRGAGSS